jgi:hypothetical protein
MTTFVMYRTMSRISDANSSNICYFIEEPSITRDCHVYSYAAGFWSTKYGGAIMQNDMIHVPLIRIRVTQWGSIHYKLAKIPATYFIMQPNNHFVATET